MKKTCLLCLLALLAALLPMAATAEGELAFPIALPGDLTVIHTQYTYGTRVDYQVALSVEEATGLRRYTIADPAPWGLSEEAAGQWAFDPETETWQKTATPTGGQVELLVSKEAYYDYAFPAWTAPCVAPGRSLTLSLFDDEPESICLYLDYDMGDGNLVSLSTEDFCFTLVQTYEVDGSEYNSYANYDPDGLLHYVTLYITHADGGMDFYTVEADNGQRLYRLSAINHMDAEGNSCYWEDGRWLNDDFQQVEAPEGLSPDAVPFTLSGGWNGIPFATPGQLDAGEFPASFLAADPESAAEAFEPWGPQEDTLYRSWGNRKLMPPLPAVTWNTLENRDVVFTVTGFAGWPVPEAAMGDWRWDGEAWQRGTEATPDRLVLICPEALEGEELIWTQPGAAQGDQVQLTLMRSERSCTMTYSHADGRSWYACNLGTAGTQRPISGNRQVETQYYHDELSSYVVRHYNDSGEPVAEATFGHTDENPLKPVLCLLRIYPPASAHEALWLYDMGWYNFETGDECEAPEGVTLEAYQPLKLK